MHLGEEVKNLIMTIVVPLLLFIWFIAAFLYEGNSWKNLRNTYNPKQAVTAPAAPHEAGEQFDPRFGQLEFFFGGVAEIPAALAALEAAIDVPAPAVEAALEFAGAAFAAAGLEAAFGAAFSAAGLAAAFAAGFAAGFFSSAISRSPQP